MSLRVIAVGLLAALAPSFAGISARAGLTHEESGDFQRGAFASLRDETVAASVYGQIFTRAFNAGLPGAPEAGQSMTACVSVVSGSLRDDGCGTVAVDIDPLLSSARVVGSIQSEVYDDDTGETGPSSITVDLSFVAAGAPRTPGNGSFGPRVAPPPSPAVDWTMGARAGYEREATATGSVISSILGGVSGGDPDAGLFQRGGVDASLGVTP